MGVTHNYSGTTVTAATGQSDPDIWADISQNFAMFVHIGLLNLLAMFGLAGNTINIIVLRKHGVINNSTNVMLIALSFFDLLFSVIVLIRQIPYIVVLADIPLAIYLYDMYTVYTVYFIDQVCTSISVTLTSAIAIERFTAVFFPFKVAIVFTPFRVKIVVICIVLYVIGLASPSFGRYKIVWHLNPKNITQITLEYTDWWASNGMFNNAILLCNNLMGTANMAIVFLCGTTTALKLVHTVHKRQRLTNKTILADVKAHKMIFLVCGTCFLVFAPTTALDLVISYYDLTVDMVLILVPNILYGIHASVNFVIYVAVSRKFYTTYKTIFSRS